MISMAIKYVVLPEKKTVIALLENTKFDAYNKALKVCHDLTYGQTDVYICPNPDKMMMPTSFRGVAVCQGNDVFDEKIGKAKAKARCLKKYYTSFDKRMNNFYESFDIIAIKRDILKQIELYIRSPIQR